MICLGKFFFKGRELAVFDSVYEPSDDSLLLADAVKAGKGEKVLDLGCGTGIQAINAALQGAEVLAADINEKALENTAENAEIFGLRRKIGTRKSDLFSAIPEKFCCIIFNPPYVPSGKIKLIDVDGGKKGREILDSFIEEFPWHLTARGRCFFLQSSLNGIEETERKLEKKGLKFGIITRKKLFFEELVVFIACP